MTVPASAGSRGDDFYEELPDVGIAYTMPLAKPRPLQPRRPATGNLRTRQASPRHATHQQAGLLPELEVPPRSSASPRNGRAASARARMATAAPPAAAATQAASAPAAADVVLLHAQRQQQALREQLAMMQAERDAALRHASTLQQSLNAALADAGACRRGLTATQQLLSQREAELRKLRGESAPPRQLSRRAPAEPITSQRRGSNSSLRRQSTIAFDPSEFLPTAATKPLEPSAAQQLVSKCTMGAPPPSPTSAGPATTPSASRLLTRAMGLFELTTAWRLFDSPAGASGGALGAATASGAPAAGSSLAEADAADHSQLLQLMTAVRWQLPAIMECRQCALLLLLPSDGATNALHTADPSGGGRRVVLPVRAAHSQRCTATTLHANHAAHSATLRTPRRCAQRNAAHSATLRTPRDAAHTATLPTPTGRARPVL